MLFLRREGGQGTVEYALLLMLVALFLLVLVAFLGQEIVATYERIRAQLAVLG